MSDAVSTNQLRVNIALVGMGVNTSACGRRAAPRSARQAGAAAAACKQLTTVECSTPPSGSNDSSSEDEAEHPGPGLAAAVCMTAIGSTGQHNNHESNATDDDPRWGHDTASKRRRRLAEARATAVLAKRNEDRQPISHADVWSILNFWRVSRSFGSTRATGHVPTDTFGIIHT